MKTFALIPIFLAYIAATPVFARESVQLADITNATDEKYSQFVSTVPKKYLTLFVEGSTEAVFDTAVKSGERISKYFGKKVVVVKVRSTREIETEACISVSYRELSLPASCTSVLPEIWNNHQKRSQPHIESVRQQYMILEESVVTKSIEALSGGDY